MITRPKFKDYWLPQPNNTHLLVQPNNQQIYIQNQFITNDWHKHCTQFYSLVRYLASPFPRNSIITIIDKEEQLHECINLLLNDQYIIVQIYNEYKLSYKGFISWILLANTNHCFLIDGIQLRDYLHLIRTVFQDSKIVKFASDWYQVAKSLKRNFGIFPVNIFDLYYLEAEYDSLAEQGTEERRQLYQDFAQNPQIISQRPIKSKMWKIINRNFKLLIQYTLKLPKHPTSKSLSQPLYLDHLLYRYQQINQPAFTLQFYHHEVQKSLTKEQQDELTPKHYKLYYSLISFREHVAKMNDISVQKIIPKPVMDKILENSKISVLQISQLYENTGCSSVGLELCKRIYDVIQLNEELHEDSQKLKAQIFEKQLNTKKQNVQPVVSIKKLLKDIQWGDSSQWLNRKDDPSIKLYKQIISIEEFDHSIGEQYLGLMKGDVIKKQDLGKYLKYAQQMRNKNYEKLENLYKMNQLIKQSNKEDEFSEQTQTEIKAQKFGRKLFDDQETEPIKSSTSLEQKVMKRMEECPQQRIRSAFMKNQSSKQIHNIEQSSQNTRSRKSSQSSLININEIDQMCIKRSDIKPLPNSIQQIYQMALEVKKKIDKKTNKKKQKKGKTDVTKQMDFVPTWEDIQKLINYTNNLK